MISRRRRDVRISMFNVVARGVCSRGCAESEHENLCSPHSCVVLCSLTASNDTKRKRVPLDKRMPSGFLPAVANQPAPIGGWNPGKKTNEPLPMCILRNAAGVQTTFQYASRMIFAFRWSGSGTR